MLCFALTSWAQDEGSSSRYTGISVRASKQIFAVMCALDAAGYDADESTLAEMPERLALRADLLKMRGPATTGLRQFYKQHVLANSAETLARFMAFAIVVGPPPDFRFQIDRDLLSPDVIALDGFQEILSDFYREANLEARWVRIEPEYEPAIARYQSVVRRVVTVTNGYARETLKPTNGRSFNVYVEPLVGNRTTFQNSGDQYVMIVGTGSQIPSTKIQHAYLHYLLDPLPLEYLVTVETKKDLMEFASRAPLLPPEYRNNFEELFDECLVKAVELRLRHLTPDQQEDDLKENDESGYILVRPLVAQLEKFEKAEPALSYYFPDLLAGINVQAEQKRLKNVTFAAAEPTTEPAPGANQAQASELDAGLADGDRAIALKDGPGAEAAFQKVLSKYPDEPRALYGLAIASVLVGKAEQATELFEKLVSKSNTALNGKPGTVIDPGILAWSHVYLGRIHDLAGERERSVSEYQAALGVAGAPESARVAAQRGIEVAYTAPGRPGEAQKP